MGQTAAAASGSTSTLGRRLFRGADASVSAIDPNEEPLERLGVTLYVEGFSR